MHDSGNSTLHHHQQNRKPRCSLLRRIFALLCVCVVLLVVAQLHIGNAWYDAIELAGGRSGKDVPHGQPFIHADFSPSGSNNNVQKIRTAEYYGLYHVMVSRPGRGGILGAFSSNHSFNDGGCGGAYRSAETVLAFREYKPLFHRWHAQMFAGVNQLPLADMLTNKRPLDGFRKNFLPRSPVAFRMSFDAVTPRPVVVSPETTVTPRPVIVSPETTVTPRPVVASPETTTVPPITSTRGPVEPEMFEEVEYSRVSTLAPSRRPQFNFFKKER